MNIKKISIYKIILIINILIFIMYSILSKSEFIFTKLALTYLLMNTSVFIITLAIVFIRSILKKLKDKVTKFILISLSIFIVIVITFNMLLIFVLSIGEEVLTYREGNLVVATSKPFGIRHTYMNFYIPINDFLMKKSHIKGFNYKGSANLYKTNNMSYKNSYIDIYSWIDFLQLNPFTAKNKFGSEKFQYLGNKTYDFGEILIKFDDWECEVEEAFITRDIVKYREKKVIGENINVIKSYIEDVNKNEGNEITYNEFFDDKGNKNINLIEKSKYGGYHSNFYFILNDDSSIASVKFVSN